MTKTVPIKLLTDDEFNNRAVDIVRSLAGVSVSEALAVLEFAETVLKQTNYVSETPDLTVLQEGLASGELLR